jgi:hypothetical protein
MKTTIKHLAEQIIDLAGELGIDADALDDEGGISGAETVVHLRDAQRSLNMAKDALALAIARQNGVPLTRGE